MEKYRTFWPRFVALLIDGFIMLPLVIVEDWFRQAEFSHLFFYLWIPLSALVNPVYKIFMHGLHGQTLGKMAMNVKVLDATEEPLKFNQAILREMPHLLFTVAAVYLALVFLGEDPESERIKSTNGVFMSFYLFWIMTDFLIFLFNDKRRALHDFLAGTTVVKTNV